MSTVTIIGGHGKVALLAAPLLTDRGHRVRSVVRDPARVGDVEATGAEAVVLDVEQADIDALTDLLRDSDVVVWSAGAGGGSPERTYAVDRDAAIRSMEAAEAAGADRYVMVSYFGAGPAHGVPEDDAFFPYADAKATADTHLRGTSLAWTILGPSRLTLAEPTGRIAVGGSRASSSEVSRANVAEVIAQVVDRGDLVRRTVEFDDGDTPVGEALDAAADS
ncbi:MAG TPA: SDR family oxidoreductase [Nocardioidaceae bacterium]|nr:SDR family oxidoreductase [Nocardioidaceae bacterium]